MSNIVLGIVTAFVSMMVLLAIVAILQKGRFDERTDKNIRRISWVLTIIFITFLALITFLYS